MGIDYKMTNGGLEYYIHPPYVSFRFKCDVEFLLTEKIATVRKVTKDFNEMGIRDIITHPYGMVDGRMNIDIETFKHHQEQGVCPWINLMSEHEIEKWFEIRQKEMDRVL